jgi:hypothetical protein
VHTKPGTARVRPQPTGHSTIRAAPIYLHSTSTRPSLADTVTARTDSELAEADEPPSGGAAHMWHDTKNNTATANNDRLVSGALARVSPAIWKIRWMRDLLISNTSDPPTSQVRCKPPARKARVWAPVSLDGQPRCRGPPSPGPVH